MGSSAAELSGQEILVKTFSGNGGITVGTQFIVAISFLNDWTIASFASETVAPGFYLLTVLETESLSAKGCKEGSVKLQNGSIQNINVCSTRCAIASARAI